MKTIGLIGGISWVSTVEYYRLINEKINQRLGGVNSAQMLIYSVNYENIKNLTFADNWPAIVEIISGIARKLETAGADCLLLGANTMHRIAGDVQQAINIPLIHIADVTGKAIKAKGLTRAALLGTRYTMELDFYPEQLQKHGIKTLLPPLADRQFVHDAIYHEMGRNIFSEATKAKTVNIIEDMAREGAECAILGCTELPILIQQQDCSIPVFDTTAIHAEAAVDFALR